MDFDEAVQAYGARIEANSATLLVGAGLSVSAGYPNWKGLLQPFITQLQLPESFDNLTMVAQYVANVEGGRIASSATSLRRLHQSIRHRRRIIG